VVEIWELVVVVVVGVGAVVAVAAVAAAVVVAVVVRRTIAVSRLAPIHPRELIFPTVVVGDVVQVVVAAVEQERLLRGQPVRLVAVDLPVPQVPQGAVAHRVRLAPLVQRVQRVQLAQRVDLRVEAAAVLALAAAVAAVVVVVVELGVAQGTSGFRWAIRFPRGTTWSRSPSETRRRPKG
jgi:hypothetical protein